MSKAKQQRKALWLAETVGERAAAQSYLDWCRIVLGLPHWKLYVGDKGPCPASAYADVTVNPTRYMARVRLCPQWKTLDAWAQANCLMHEALHVSHHMLTEVVHADLAHGLPKQQQDIYNLISESTLLQCERMVDQLATALTDALEAANGRRPPDGLRQAWFGYRQRQG